MELNCYIKEKIKSIKDEELALLENSLLASSRKNQILQSLGSRECCSLCPLKNSNSQIMPLGSTLAPLMIIAGAVTELEGQIKVPFYDAKNRFIHVLLDRLKINKEYVYMTTLCKCHQPTRDINTSYGCANNYLMREILIVKPKVIIGLGIDVTRVLFDLLPPVSKIQVTDVLSPNVEPFRNQFHTIDIDFNQYGAISTDYIQTYGVNQLLSDFEKISPNLSNDFIVAARKSGLIR